MISYKTIMVCLTDHRRTEEVVDAVLALARRYGSHVIGVYAYSGISWPPMPVPGSGQVHGATVASAREEAERLATEFSRITANQPITAEWRSLPAAGFDIGSVVVDLARCSDLVVVGQATQDCDAGAAIELAERLAVESGRPVLALPNAGHVGELGRNVLVAWKSTREAARAVFDALPLLREADRVRILEIRDASAPDDGSKRELVAALGRHGVAATFESVVASDADAGAELLSRLAEQGADLMVMGAYGHPRLLQFVFGGVTRHVARHMTVPTLWSH